MGSLNDIKNENEKIEKEIKKKQQKKKDLENEIVDLNHKMLENEMRHQNQKEEIMKKNREHRTGIFKENNHSFLPILDFVDLDKEYEFCFKCIKDELKDLEISHKQATLIGEIIFELVGELRFTKTNIKDEIGNSLIKNRNLYKEFNFDIIINLYSSMFWTRENKLEFINSNLKYHKYKLLTQEQIQAIKNIIFNCIHFWWRTYSSDKYNIIDLTSNNISKQLIYKEDDHLILKKIKLKKRGGREHVCPIFPQIVFDGKSITKIGVIAFLH
ncbi:hypothetical protein M0813_08418 [Anaeramoeba flamelloides]|uniref:Uncharacterized protein n=1 Tax=Anaeramoeba flamelloides TaxID=1746091 RepID=A0ABQ8XA15_9EUKA|nr:hypothetical protein M0813_08418 [Anaeramoeba flamelloides]